MTTFQRNFTPVCEHESDDAGVTCETGQKSEPCKVNLGKRMLVGMKGLLKGRQATAAAASSSSADSGRKCVDESSGSEADDLVLGEVLQTLRVLLSALDVDLALCFIEDLVVCGLSRAKVSWKREAYVKRLGEFVNINSEQMSAAVAFELLSITGPTQCGRRAVPKGLARGTPSSEPAVSPSMQRQISAFSASCSLGSAESACTDGEQVPEERASQRSMMKKKSTPNAISPASQRARTGTPDCILTEETNPVQLKRVMQNSSTSASSTELTSPEACLRPVRRRPWKKTTNENKSTAHRNSDNHDRRTHDSAEGGTRDSAERRSHDKGRGSHHVRDSSVVSRKGTSQCAQWREGVWSSQVSAEQHPDFDHHLAAELQQYHVDRVLRLGQSVRGG